MKLDAKSRGRTVWTVVIIFEGEGVLLCYNIGGMLYILYGRDDFSLSQALDSLKRQGGDPEALGINTINFDAQQLSLSQLAEACNAMPFLSPVRIVIVKGLLGLFERRLAQGQGRKRSPKKLGVGLGEWEGLVDCVRQMPPTTMLILVDSGDIRRDNPLLKLLLPLAEVKVFPQPDRAELSRLIYSRVRDGGSTMSAKAVNLLIDLVGYDLWAINSEVDKLLAFAQRRLITEDDVRCVVSFAREANIFNLVDAILGGERKLAQEMLLRVLREGASPAYVLAMIARQLRLIVIAKELGDKVLRGEVIGRTENASDYSLRKALEQSKRYSLERVKKAFEKLLETDVAIKTGKFDGDLALELLLTEL